MVVSQFNGTSIPKGSYSAKTGDNDCNVNMNVWALSYTAADQHHRKDFVFYKITGYFNEHSK